MYELVELKGNDVFTNSKVIADGTNNQHESVVAIIRKYEKDILDFGNIDFSDLKSGKRGQPERVYYLNEEQATFVITLLRNSKIVVKFKKELVRQFSDKLYVTYTKLAKSVIGGNRDNITVSDLNNLTLVESIILQTIRIDMSMGMHYKDIYRDCKNRIEQFADITYLSA